MQVEHSITLSDGTKIPRLGFGTGSLWFKDEAIDFDQNTSNAVQQAVRKGFIHVDTAEKYGTETEVGSALRESGVARDQIFVTTKVLAGVQDIPKAIESSLKRLGLDYVDLFLIHEPFWAQSDEDLEIAWKAMEYVKATGKTKSIGVSNFRQQQLEVVLKVAKVRPAINQIEMHPYLQDISLIEFHKKHSIATVAYAPLTPLRIHPGPLDDTLSTLAQKYSVCKAAILLRWCFDQGLGAITTSASENELDGCLQSFTFTLTSSELLDLSQKGAQKRFRSFYREYFD